MTSPAARRIVRFARVASTQNAAFALAEEGAAEGTVVVADTQTAGRGRRGRTWLDEPGASLLASIVLRPRLPAALLPTLSLTAGVAVCAALERTSGLAPRLKWPNDVLVGGRKIAGILLESRAGADPVPLVVVGIGVNLGQTRFPDEVATRATSVALETGRALDRDALLAVLLEELDRWRGRLEDSGFEAVRARWRALADTLGRRVTIEGVTGQAVDIDETGALVLESNGARRRVVAGEIAEGTAHAARA